MRGDAFGEPHVCASGEKDLAAMEMLLLEEGEQGPVIGQVRYVQRNGLGDIRLERGFAVEQAAGQAEKAAGMGAEQDQEGVDESVGFDEGAVEIDAEGRKRFEGGVQLNIFGGRAGAGSGLKQPHTSSEIAGGGREGFGGAERDRTAGLLVANEALSQLSYSPTT